MTAPSPSETIGRTMARNLGRTTIAVTALVGLLIVFCTPAYATQRRLSGSEAAHAIRAYEHAYWKELTTLPTPITISQCKRYSATHISCLARIIVDEFWAFSRDWATLSPNGSVVVNPGAHLDMHAFRSPEQANE